MLISEELREYLCAHLYKFYMSYRNVHSDIINNNNKLEYGWDEYVQYDDNNNRFYEPRENEASAYPGAIIWFEKVTGLQFRDYLDRIVDQKLFDKLDNDIVPIVLLFTPRSGSNVIGHQFCEIFTSGSYCFEPLNPDVFKVFSYLFNPSCFSHYLSIVAQLNGARLSDGRKAFVFKVDTSHFERLVMTRFWGRFSDNAILIRLRRLDRVAQAVSLYVADKTVSWASFQRPHRPNSALSGNKLYEHYQRIAILSDHLDELVIVKRLRVVESNYESYTENPRGFFDLLAKNAGIGMIRRFEALPKPPFGVQRDATYDLLTETLNKVIEEATMERTAHTFCGKVARDSHEKTDNIWPSTGTNCGHNSPRLWRCSECGLRFFDRDEVSARWDQGTSMRGRHDINHEYSEHHTPAVLRFIGLARELLGIQFGPFLHHDVGCAFGHLVYHMRRNGLDSTGSELDTAAAMLGRQRPEWDGHGDRFLFTESLKTCLTTKQNLITLVHVLEHVCDPAALLNDVHDLLDDRGLVFISLPNALHLPNGRFGLVHSDRIGIDAEHLSFFTPKSLQCLCESVGLEIVHLTADTDSFHHRMQKEWIYSAIGRFNNELVNHDILYQALNENFLTYQIKLFAKRKDSRSIPSNFDVARKIKLVGSYEQLSWVRILEAVESCFSDSVMIGGGGHSLIDFMRQTSSFLPDIKKEIFICGFAPYYNGLAINDQIAGFRVLQFSEVPLHVVSLICVSETSHDFDNNLRFCEALLDSDRLADVVHLKLFE